MAGGQRRDGGVRRHVDARPVECVRRWRRFIGIGISFYPNIVPPGLTIVEAAAPDKSLRFALVGTVAGWMNDMAGGGSMLTVPVMLFMGEVTGDL